MSGIPEETVIILTAEERTELEGLARSTKTEHRLRQTNKRILALLDQPPPEGYARWTGPLLAAALGASSSTRPRSYSVRSI